MAKPLMKLVMKKFPLRTLLTVTTGRLLAHDFQDLYDILGWMTTDKPATHQLGRFADECKPWLLRWFPELAEAEKHLTEDSGKNSLDYAITCVKVSGNDIKYAIDNWLELCVTDWNMKHEYNVDKIPADDHVIKNGYDELVEIRGTDEDIILIDRRIFND